MLKSYKRFTAPPISVSKTFCGDVAVALIVSSSLPSNAR